MKFEYRLSSIGYGNIPDLVVPVSEIHQIVRLKDKDPDGAFAAEALLKKCVIIYTSYCGRRQMLAERDFRALEKQLGETGELVISCVEPGDAPVYRCRYVSDKEEEVGSVFRDLTARRE